MTDAKVLLKSASRPERTVEVCLDAALQAEWEILTERLEHTGGGGQPLLNRLDERGELAAKIADVEENMRASTVTLRFRALPRREWVALTAQHAPRDGNAEDRIFGYDVDATAEAAARAGLVDPELDDDDWAALDDALSQGQWMAIRTAVLAVNAGKADVPFSRAASRILQASSPTSEPPETSG